MGATQLKGKQVLDGSIQRVDLDVSTTGQAVITKIIQGTGISLSSTGVDAGTGDVTINNTGVTGTGTLNILPKYTGTGSTIGNSSVSDDGTSFTTSNFYIRSSHASGLIIQPTTLPANLFLSSYGTTSDVRVNYNYGGGSGGLGIYDGGTTNLLQITASATTVTYQSSSAAHSFNGALKLTTAPTTSAGTYDVLTRNISTGIIEKITSSSIATDNLVVHLAGAETITGLKTIQRAAGITTRLLIGTDGTNTLFELRGYWNTTKSASSLYFGGGGASANFVATTDASQNTSFGYNALLSVTTGTSNTGIGNDSLKTLTTGNWNTCIGQGSGQAILSGTDNSAFGQNALRVGTGNANMAFGSNALDGITTGSNNVGIGQFSGFSNSSANATNANNVYIGQSSGKDNIGSGNLFLGYLSGSASATTSNKLYIANTATNSPLIYGEFDNTIVTVNGFLGIGANPNSVTSLDVVSTTRGVRFTPMTTTQRNAITAIDGLMIYNTTTTQYEWYKTNTWTAMTGAGGSGVTTMAAIGSTPNANGASISGVTLTLQPADATFGGVLTATTQGIKGVKQFQDSIQIYGTTNTLIGATNSSTQTIAGASGTINATFSHSPQLFTLTANFNNAALLISGTGGAVTTASSGTHNFLGEVVILAPVLTLNATTPATITNAATLYIDGAPTGNAAPATNNYAVWIDNGTVRLDGAFELQGIANTSTANTLYYDTTTKRVTYAAAGGGSGADALGRYIVQIATNAPANAQILASLGTGLVKNTTTTGVLSIAIAGTDYVTPYEISGLLNSDANSTYTDLKNYGADVTTGNGFPVNGRVTGYRSGTTNVQRLQDTAVGSTYARYWINGSTAWSVWSLYLDAQDFTAKGQLLSSSASNTLSVVSAPASDGQVLTANAASAAGMLWSLPTFRTLTITGTGAATLVSGTLNIPTPAWVYNGANIGFGTSSATDKVQINDNATAATNILGIHTDDQNTIGMALYNDTYSTTIPAFKYFINNAGTVRFVTTSTPITFSINDNTNQAFIINSNGTIQLPNLTAGITKTDSVGVISLATAGTDYQAPVSTTDHDLLFSANVLTTNKTPLALTDAATITWNRNSGANSYVTLGGNRTLSITNSLPGDLGSLIITQDGTGGRTLTVPDGSVALNSAAAAETFITYYYNGTKYFWFVSNGAFVTGTLTSNQVILGNGTNNIKSDAGLVFDPSTQKLSLGGTDTGILLTGITNEPAAPAASTLIAYSKSVSGRMMFKMKGPSGIDTPLQPALFGNTVFMVSPNTTTTMSNIGGTITSGGTMSHPTPTATSYGFMANFVSGAVATNPAGTGGAIAPYIIGSGAAGHAGGWFSSARCFFPDASYGSGATGFTCFVGMTDQTLATAVASDNATGSRAGFAISTNLSEANFMFSTRSASGTETRTSTTMAFTALHMYDFYTFIPPSGTTIYWRIDDITAGTTRSGSVTAALPPATTLLRYIAAISTLTTTARNFRIKKLYVETDL